MLLFISVNSIVLVYRYSIQFVLVLVCTREEVNSVIEFLCVWFCSVVFNNSMVFRIFGADKPDRCLRSAAKKTSRFLQSRFEKRNSNTVGYC